MFLIRMKHPLVMIAAAVFFVAAIWFFAAQRGTSSPLPQPVAVNPALLQSDLDVRLKHLQSRVTGASFFVKKVAMRENLWKIAQRHGYSVHSILGCNPQMTSYNVDINNRLLLPSRGGTLHPLQKGDTWESIAQRYDIPAADLERCNGNVTILAPGEFIFVPGRMPDVELMNDRLREKYELRALFVSPLSGRLTSSFGKRRHPVTGQRSFHGGIDLAVPQGSWVGAAADGVVSFAGDNAGHYGKAVFITHQGGYETHYGHLSRIFVRTGQRVSARKLIAKSGSTGRSTGPHLHFTIKKNGACLDPLKFLW
jgi:LysM repeat protein